MKLDISISFVDIDGDQVKDAKGNPETLGSILARALVNTPDGDALKHLDWAISLKSGKPVDLDTSDWQYLKDFVKNNKSLFNIVKGPILKVMIAAEAAKTSPA